MIYCIYPGSFGGGAAGVLCEISTAVFCGVLVKLLLPPPTLMRLMCLCRSFIVVIK